MKDFHSLGVKNINAGNGDAPRKLPFFFCFVGLLESSLHPQMKTGIAVGQKGLNARAVFTYPLSLRHRLNLVAICFPPEMVECFTPEWASAERYSHWKGWDRFELGETDHLAERAHQAVGGYLLRRNS